MRYDFFIGPRLVLDLLHQPLVLVLVLEDQILSGVQLQLQAFGALNALLQVLAQIVIRLDDLCFAYLELLALESQGVVPNLEVFLALLLCVEVLLHVSIFLQNVLFFQVQVRVLGAELTHFGFEAPYLGLRAHEDLSLALYVRLLLPYELLLLAMLLSQPVHLCV